jgi:TonB family protein
MSKTEAWKTWEGRVVDGKYPLRQWLGGSDHSAVFLTERVGRPSEKAAIKLVEANGADVDREVARLRAASKLSHPNLISIYEAGRSRIDDTPLVYVSMEYAEEDLSQILPQRPLTPGEVSDMLSPLLDGLSYLHDKGLAHGRIKPSNVLAVGDQLKLSTDQVTPAGEPISAQRRVGVYDAPETAAGKAVLGADVWSLGVTIVAALTQKATPSAQGDPALPGGLAEPFAGIARECLHIDPKQRCSLDNIRARLLPPGRSVPAYEEPSTAPIGESNRLPVFVIPLVIVVVALAAWGLFRSRGKESSSKAPEAAPQSIPQAAPVPAPTPAVEVVKPAKKAAIGGTVVRQVMPDIPQSARNTISGTIKISVRVEVDSSGKVTSAKLKSAGPSRYFSGRVLKAAQEWEFAPPDVNGQPAPSVWLLQFRLRRTSIQASPERLTR